LAVFAVLKDIPLKALIEITTFTFFFIFNEAA
jgi:hypothetical protein